jgi:hypothetical protein
MFKITERAYTPRTSFTPAGFKRAKKRFDRGDWRPLIAMMQEAREDGQVQGCLVGRAAGYKRPAAWRSPDGFDLPDERLQWYARTMDRLNLRELLEDIHQARLYGYAVLAFEWEVIDGYQVPTGYRAFQPHHFRYDPDGRPGPGGELMIDDAGSGAVGYRRSGGGLRPIPDEALVVENRRMPLMMPVLRDFILKEFGLEAWSSFLENFGEAFIFARYPEHVDEDFKEEVQAGVEKLARTSKGSAPEGTEVDVVESNRSTGDHEQYAARCDRSISVALLGHANATRDSGGVNVGGQQHSYEVRHSIARDDCFWLEPHVTTLARRVGRQNFASGDYARYNLDKSKPLTREQRADYVDMAYRHGVPIAADEYRKLGIHVPEGAGPFQNERRSPLNDLMD